MTSVYDCVLCDISLIMAFAIFFFFALYLLLHAYMCRCACVRYSLMILHFCDEYITRL